MRLVTDVSPTLDGAWIIGIIEFNNIADQILMLVCVETPAQNTVAGWSLGRGETEGVYQVLYETYSPAEDRYKVAPRRYTNAMWVERSVDALFFTNLIDVSECW